MWLGLLARFWPWLAGIALVIGAYGWAHHAGYESGYAASEAKWQPAFAQAERERDAANARTRTMEESSKTLSDRIEKQHAETMASLNLRADTAEQRYAHLLRQRTAGARCGAVPPVPGSTAEPDATRASSELIDRTSRDFAALARRCESDAATLKDLQQWVTEQRGIMNAGRPTLASPSRP